MEFPADQNDDLSDPDRRKKRYHRHTANQIQRLESLFRECAHPDEKTRNMLSRELGLHPRQIKFWFQNRRTQMKAQHERAGNCSLRAENDKIRCENITMREALKNVICPSCGGPPVSEDPYFDDQKLRMENAQLKEELDRVSTIAAKYIGRPISQLPPVHPVHIPSLDLSMAAAGAPSLDLDLDLLPGTSSSVIPNLPTLSEMDKSLMADIATTAMEEMIRLLQNNEPFWMTRDDDPDREILNLDSYQRVFPSQLKNPNFGIEASRDSGVAIMNALALVNIFMDVNKWVQFFPTIISRARMIEVITPGMLGGQSGALQLMYGEFQLLSPLVPTRQVYFLRFCQQIEQGLWAIVDVSYDNIPGQENEPSKAHRRLPSGCLLQDMPNGYSKVTWLEHWQVEDKDNVPIHRLYRDLIRKGLAFGAHRWLSTLQRVCERFACLMVAGNSSRDLGGVIPSAEGKRSMMKLAERMVHYFCSSINPCNGQQWTNLGLNEFEGRTTVYRSTDPGQPNGVVLSAAATIWLPIPPQNVFNFFKDERTRPQWDVLSNQNSVSCTMKSYSRASILLDTKSRRCIWGFFSAMLLICGVYFVGGAWFRRNSFLSLDSLPGVGIDDPKRYSESVKCVVSVSSTTLNGDTRDHIHAEKCNERCRPVGSEALPQGIVSITSNLQMIPLSGPMIHDKSRSKSLLTLAVGVKQKRLVDDIVEKFLGDNFAVMLFHYDGIVDEWRDFEWNDRVIHISATNQTKWWFAKRFLHPDIVDEYEYIFLWDEDLGVENFHPERYVAIIKEAGLEISQPALDPGKSEVHHHITVRNRRTRLHRRYYRRSSSGSGKCDGNSTSPPCVGWVEMMAPVFSRAAWRCSWYMIQNDLIHAWGLDRKLGYCAQGDRTVKVGVVDQEYITHIGLPTLGGPSDKDKRSTEVSSFQAARSKRFSESEQSESGSNGRFAVRKRSYDEMRTFTNRWNNAVKMDKCWIDPFPLPSKRAIK